MAGVFKNWGGLKERQRFRVIRPLSVPNLTLQPGAVVQFVEAAHSHYDGVSFLKFKRLIPPGGTFVLEASDDEDGREVVSRWMEKL